MLLFFFILFKDMELRNWIIFLCVCVCVHEGFFLSWTLTPGSPRSPTNGERPPRFPSFSPVRWNTAGRLPYHYHIISITLPQHSLTHCLQTCYQLIKRFNPQSSPCFPPLPPCSSSLYTRGVFHLSKADVIEAEHWIYWLNEITQMLHDQPRLPVVRIHRAASMKPHCAAANSEFLISSQK